MSFPQKPPLFLRPKYGALAAIGDYFNTPNAVANQITGDIDLRGLLSLNNWSAALQGISSKDDGSTTGSYSFFVQNGILSFAVTDGVTRQNSNSGVVLPFSANFISWVRCTYSTATGFTNYYTSNDGFSWLQSGIQQTLVGSNINISAYPLTVGALFSYGAFPLLGKIYRAQILNGINGPIAVDFNPNEWAAGPTWNSSTGEIWTINGAASIQSA